MKDAGEECASLCTALTDMMPNGSMVAGLEFGIFFGAPLFGWGGSKIKQAKEREIWAQRPADLQPDEPEGTQPEGRRLRKSVFDKSISIKKDGDEKTPLADEAGDERKPSKEDDHHDWPDAQSTA